MLNLTIAGVCFLALLVFTFGIYCLLYSSLKQIEKPHIHDWSYLGWNPASFKYCSRECKTCPKEEIDQLPAIAHMNYWIDKDLLTKNNL